MTEQQETAKTPKQLAAESREVPDGYELVAVPSVDWRLKSGKRCRQPACTNPSVAELNRRRRMSGGVKRDSWWAYCLSDLYANWIEDGQVWHWILREKENAGA